VACLRCLGEPRLLKEGGRGWFERSTHLDWRFGWRLCLHWSVTTPKEDYGLPSPVAGQHEFVFAEQESRWKPYDIGTLAVEDRSLTARFVIPDCLEAPFKSFAWGAPLLLDSEVFHCQLRLELYGQRDGSYLVRRPATRGYASGVDFGPPAIRSWHSYATRKRPMSGEESNAFWRC
jgi:hypothetical protein